jgi:hypothetical protein
MRNFLMWPSGQVIVVGFNLSTQEATVVNGTPSPATSVQSIGNGWYRCSITATTAATTGTAIARFSTQDGGGTFYIWGAQLEVGAFPTSYIPTTAAAATRSADSALITPITSFYNATESTLFHETAIYANAATTAVLQIDNETAENRILVGSNVSPTATAATVLNSSGQPYLNNPGFLAGTHKVAGAFKADDFASSVNGGAVVTDSSGAMPVAATHLRLASNITGQNTCRIRKIAYWPKRLSNTLLQSLTA